MKGFEEGRFSKNRSSVIVRYSGIGGSFNESIG